MRGLMRASALAALILSAWISVAASADTTPSFENGQRFVVVTFANDPYRPASRAGSTGRKYSGGTYGVAQGAHNAAKQVANIYSLKQVDSWPIKQLGVHCVVYEITDGRPVKDVLAALTQDPKITLAQPLQEFHTLTSPPQDSYNDPLYGLQTNLVSLDIAAAHERAQGAGVKVALIDTGVDARHQDLRDRILSSRSFVPANATLVSGAGGYRHGTAMAGLIAAVANNNIGIVGIAPLAQIEVFEACWQLRPNADAAACNSFTLAKAIAAAIDARAPVVNMSIAGPADPLLSALVQSGLERGMIFVGSAPDATDSFPANINGIIAVGNSDGNRTGATLAAPATHVMTLMPGNEYDFESGTSVAAAEVTGVVALLLSANRRLTGDAIVSLLKGTPAAATEPLSIDVDAALAKVQADKTGQLASRGQAH